MPGSRDSCLGFPSQRLLKRYVRSALAGHIRHRNAIIWCRILCHGFQLDRDVVMIQRVEQLVICSYRVPKATATIWHL